MSLAIKPISLGLTYAATDVFRPLAYFSYSNNLLSEPYKKHTAPKKVCLDEAVLFEQGLDNHLHYEFPNAETVFFHRCDKNFVFYNLRKDTFPNLQRFYTNSHPCDFNVMHRFADKKDYVGCIISPFYQYFLNHWWHPTTRHVKEIKVPEYELLLASYTRIDPTFEGDEQ